jgi:hypothetical protein
MPAFWSQSRRPTLWPQLIALGFPAVVAVAALLWSRPWMNPDTSTALRAWDGWIHHGQWNRIIAPSPADLNADTASWLSWWSPGQYLWTGCFDLLTGNLGVAAVLSALAGCWIKSIGLDRLLRAFAVDPTLAWWVVAAEAVSWNLYFGFGFYSGAEVVQAAYFPWFLLALTTLGRADRPTLRWLWLIPLFFAAAAIKYSMEIACAAGGAWLAGEVLLNKARPWSAKLAAAAYVGLALGAMALAAQRLLINGAPDPSQSGESPLVPHLAWSFALIAPFLSSTGFGSIASHSFFEAGKSAMTGWESLVPALMAAAAPLLLFYVWLCWAQPDRRFGRLLAWMLATYSVAIAALLDRHASVSLDDRHFRLPGILLLAGMVLIALDRRALRPNWRWSRGLLGGLAVLTALYGASSALLRIRTIVRLDRVATCGLTLPNLDPAADRELLRLDRAAENTRNVIFVAEAALSVEVRHSRLIATDLADQPSRFDSLRFHGQVDQLTLVLPAAWARSAQLGRTERLFPDYPPAAWHSWVVGSCCFAQARIAPGQASHPVAAIRS